MPGEHYSEAEQKIILNVYRKCQEEARKKRSVPTQNPALRAAQLCGVSRSTVTRISDNSKIIKKTHPGNHKNKLIPEYLQFTIRYVISDLQKKHAEGQYISAQMVLDQVLFQNPQAKLTVRTIRNYLRRFGYKYRKGNKYKYIRKSPYIVNRRNVFIGYLKRNRDNALGYGKKLPVIYLDESYVDQNKGWIHSWFYGNKDEINVPPSRGKRWILLSAISKKGLVSDRLNLIKLCKPECKEKKLGDIDSDYHGNMNGDLFEAWFAKLCIILREKYGKCIIVMDNASYHSRKSNVDIPPSKMNKTQLLEFCRNYNIMGVTYEMSKKVLYDFVRCHYEKLPSKCDILASQCDHILKYLPPYYPELNPIETCWGIIKSYIMKHFNIHQKSEQDVLALIEAGFNQITPAITKSLLKKSYYFGKELLKTEYKDLCDFTRWGKEFSLTDSDSDTNLEENDEELCSENDISPDE